MIIIGLTGSFGTGKTFVASVFKTLGAKVIDADEIAHKALKKNSAAYHEIIDFFGEDVLDERGDVDRKKLAKEIFNNKAYLKKLDNIVHPEVIRYIRGKVSSSRDKGVIIIDAPLLIEANLRGICDKLVVVKSSRKNQVERCMRKFGISESDVLKRVRSQMPLESKIKIADFVVDNDSTKSDTRKQVRKIWKKISRNMAL